MDRGFDGVRHPAKRRLLMIGFAALVEPLAACKPQTLILPPFIDSDRDRFKALEGITRGVTLSVDLRQENFFQSRVLGPNQAVFEPILLRPREGRIIVLTSRAEDSSHLAGIEVFTTRAEQLRTRSRIGRAYSTLPIGRSSEILFDRLSMVIEFETNGRPAKETAEEGIKIFLQMENKILAYQVRRPQRSQRDYFI